MSCPQNSVILQVEKATQPARKNAQNSPRGYYYDTETEFYYLQSRYYDPEICRFINADSYASTGQGFLGYNMFAYCGNDSVNHSDTGGNARIRGADCGGGLAYAGALQKSSGLPGLLRFGLRIYNVFNKTYAFASTIRNTVAARPTIDYNDCSGYSVYIMTQQAEPANVGYVGITMHPSIRNSQHRADSSKNNLNNLEVKFTGLTKVQARVMEQILISAYRLQKNSGLLQNKRNEIAVGNIPKFIKAVYDMSAYFPGMSGMDMLGLIGG